MDVRRKITTGKTTLPHNLHMLHQTEQQYLRLLLQQWKGGDDSQFSYSLRSNMGIVDIVRI